MSTLPSLRQLRYLCALAEQLNFTRAAEACFVTQSTLSAGLKELEQTLGARLVERDRQHVLLTPLGADVVERSRVLLAAATDLAELARAGGAPMSGMLRVGAIPTVAPFLLPRMLADLRSAFPRLKLALREDLTANLLARIESGLLDFAIIALPYDVSGLLTAPLFGDELWLVGLPGEALLASERVRIGAPVSERLLLLEEGHCLREHVLSACPAKHRPEGMGIEATSLLTLVQMVESGLGLALVPEMALRAGMLTGTSLLARPLAAPAPRRDIVLVARPSTARRAEFDALASRLVALEHARRAPVTTSRGRRASQLRRRSA